MSQARYDRWRLRHSKIGIAGELIAQLDAAIGTLAATGPESQGGGQGEAAQAAGGLRAQEARAMLREVRHSLNEFRGNRQAGLVRARNRLVRTGTFPA